MLEGHHGWGLPVLERRSEREEKLMPQTMTLPSIQQALSEELIYAKPPAGRRLLKCYSAGKAIVGENTFFIPITLHRACNLVIDQDSLFFKPGDGPVPDDCFFINSMCLGPKGQ
jgi:hypothetical protein